MCHWNKVCEPRQVEGGDAERYVDEALSLGYRTIIAAGGDGSVRDITQAMMASVPPFISMGPRAPGSARASPTPAAARAAAKRRTDTAMNSRLPGNGTGPTSVNTRTCLGLLCPGVTQTRQPGIR